MKHDPVELMLENSFRNFHSKGLDYLCVKRSPSLTRKVYFFEGDVSKLPEVVNPHDHRYAFTTRVLTGVMSNSYYEPDDEAGDVYQEFEWRTPLLGGDGFTWKKETRLLENLRFALRPGETYRMRVDQLHTIRMHADETMIVLDQFEDVVPADQPTRTFVHEKAPPSLDGLYDRFTSDQLISRLEQYLDAERSASHD